MDCKRKLEILVAADFSEWREWWRAKSGGKEPSTAHGFGHMLFGMAGAASLLAQTGCQSEERLQLLISTYQHLVADYATIPFDEMDRSDEDFRFLFDYKAGLEKLGQKVEAFASKTRAHKMKASEAWPEYQDLMTTIHGLMKTDYRAQVLKKYNIAYA